ncbi:MAG: hypothetical protein AAFR55_02560, partial [Pseudomonadota bacterium]
FAAATVLVVIAAKTNANAMAHAVKSFDMLRLAPVGRVGETAVVLHLKGVWRRRRQPPANFAFS